MVVSEHTHGELVPQSQWVLQSLLRVRAGRISTSINKIDIPERNYAQAFHPSPIPSNAFRNHAYLLEAANCCQGLPAEKR
jgi:hypothetical protein